MAIYTIQFQIQSNAPVEELGYQLEVYKTVNDIPRYALNLTPITPLQADYKTQLHKSLDIDPAKDQHFVMYFMLYRKMGGQYKPVFGKPQTKVYSLENPPTLSDNKIENIRYFLAIATTTLQQANNQVTPQVVKITARKRPFEDPDYKEGTPQDPFSKARIEQQLHDRITGFNYPNQEYTSFCGAAVFFYCLLKDQPSIYEQVVWDLWNYGNVQIGNLKIKASENCKHPNSLYKLDISGIDWITLASLRDTENLIMSTKVRDAGTTIGFMTEGLAGITTVSDAKSWFEKVGSNSVFDNTMLWTPFGLNHAKLKHLCDLNLYAGKPNYHVIALIGSGMFGANDGTDYLKPSKDHWVVWESKMTLLNGDEVTESTPLTERVKLKAFSWGEVRENFIRARLTLGDVLEHVFGGFVVTKIL